MRPWLLLVSLLVSDPSPLGDRDWVMENYSWSLDIKLLLNGRMTPRGLEILQIQTEHHCMCVQRYCLYGAVQHKQRTSPFYWAYAVSDDRGCSLCPSGIIHRNHIPSLVVFFLHGKGKRVPAFLAKLDTLSALHVLSEITPTKAGGHDGIAIIKGRHDLGSAWLLYRNTAASGISFKAFSLEKSKSWAPATIVRLQKMLTKRCSAAMTVIISLSFKKAGMISELKIKKTSKQQMAQPQKRQRDTNTKQAMKTTVVIKDNGQRPSRALVSQQDIFPAATLHSGSSSMKTTDTSKLEIQSNAVRLIKKNERMNLDEESLLRKSVQRQHSLKAASSVHDDGFYVKRQLLFVPREKTEYMKRPQFKTRAAQDDKRDFSGKIITKQAEFRRLEGESETQQSHINTIKNGNQKRLAYIHQADKADNNDVDRKQMLTKVGEDVLIMLFLADAEMETKTEPLSESKLILNTDTGWKTVNIPIRQLDDPPPTAKIIKENFVIEPDHSKCNCLKEGPFSLEINAPYRTKKMDEKPAERTATVTTESAHTEAQVKGTGDKIENTETDNTFHGNMSINHENVPSEESVIPSPPSLRMMQPETAKTTAVNTEIKETTSSMEAFNQASTQTADRLPSTETPTTTTIPRSETDTKPGFITCKTNKNIQATTEKLFSGLRMRQDIPADMTQVHDGTENEAATNRPETKRKEDQNDPKANSFIFAKPSQTIRKQAPGKPPETTAGNLPLCRGLIHRTEAGWKHCVERFAGMGSKMFSSREATDAFKDTEEREEHTDNPLNDDEYDHFYYLDGVMRRVQNNFYPYYKRQRRQKRSHDDSENSVIPVTERGDTHENLLSYIRRLALRNKDSHFK